MRKGVSKLQIYILKPCRAEEEGLAGPHALQLDWFLWERGERERATAPPHHRTRTTFY